MQSEEKVIFTYPEGFNAAAQALDFVPEEARVGTLLGVISFVQQI